MTLKIRWLSDKLEDLYDAHDINNASSVNAESGKNMEDFNNSEGSAVWNIAAQHIDDPVKNALIQEFVMTKTVGFRRLQNELIESLF